MNNAPYMFNVIRTRPARSIAKRFEKAANAYKGSFVEITEANGDYKGWFEIPNQGSPFNEQRANALRTQLGL